MNLPIIWIFLLFYGELQHPPLSPPPLPLLHPPWLVPSGSPLLLAAGLVIYFIIFLSCPFFSFSSNAPNGSYLSLMCRIVFFPPFFSFNAPTGLVSCLFL